MKKLLTVLLATMLLLLPLSSLVGCNRGDEREVDPTKTQFYIGNYDGGVGRTWIETLALQFEEDYKDTHFEDGKTGIQIWFSHMKDEYKSGNILTTMPNYREDIYFLDSIIYEDFVSQNRLLDISDVLLTAHIRPSRAKRSRRAWHCTSIRTILITRCPSLTTFWVSCTTLTCLRVKICTTTATGPTESRTPMTTDCRVPMRSSSSCSQR